MPGIDQLAIVWFGQTLETDVDQQYIYGRKQKQPYSQVPFAGVPTEGEGRFEGMTSLVQEE